MNGRSPGGPPRAGGGLSPAGFLLLAGVLALAYAGCTLAGLREDTTLLSGTAAAGGWAATQYGCAAYLLAYFGFVLVAPILVLAAGLLALWGRWSRRARTGPSV